jgi:hypothetical protein
MSGRDKQMYDEAAALWRELFGEPPPARADACALFDVIMRRLPEKRYERMASPYLRPSQISSPRYEAR